MKNIEIPFCPITCPNGLEPGTVSLFIGDSKVGKTATLLQIAKHNAVAGAHVLYFSCYESIDEFWHPKITFSSVKDFDSINEIFLSHGRSGLKSDKATLVIIDGIDMLGSGYEKMIRSSADFQRFVQETGVVGLASATLPPYMQVIRDYYVTAKLGPFNYSWSINRTFEEVSRNLIRIFNFKSIDDSSDVTEYCDFSHRILTPLSSDQYNERLSQSDVDTGNQYPVPGVMAQGWETPGRKCDILGPNVKNRLGVEWTPIIWNDENDPEYVKASAIIREDVNAVSN